MRTKLTLGFTFALLCFALQAQYIIKDGSELLNLTKLPQEKAYVDHTGPLLFSGEYLYYSFYCFNAQTNKRTDISKIGYVALVNESKSYVFEHKLKLDKGLGQGDFFITTAVPSGKYKLLGYTQWMKNNGLSQVFKDDIVIINPYMVDQSSLLKENVIDTAAKVLPQSLKTTIDSSTIAVRSNKAIYNPREKVNLSIKNYKGYLGDGAYSVKVKRLDDINAQPAMSAMSYGTSYFNTDKKISKQIGDSLFLPEQRGELIFGSLKDVLTNEPVQEVPVVISIPGKEFLLKFSQTDQNGNFYSYLRKDYKNAVAIVQVEDEAAQYRIEKGKRAKLNVDNLTFASFTLSKDHAKKIKSRSILNQIENQFFSAKPDSILQGDPIDPFDGGLPEVVVLDDYTRFATFEETLTEVVKFSGYRSGGQENDYIKVAQDFETYNEEFNSFPAIVLIDGVYIPNHEKIKQFDARKIEKISLIRDQFRLGGKDYQGIVAVETFEGDFLEGYTNVNTTIVTLDKPLPKKNYYTQTYTENEDSFSRIPDYRSLLFWKPHVIIDGNGGYDFEFFTSDIEGEYEVILNGFTSYGKPITIKKVFSVTNMAQ
ncbi:hypothetical protein [uncultured Croceitalea sp.]|uniref:hypothetical protein n=1 Tax=uncultured Croceitalea sp. TaxID=1798908 RepID=UPI0033060AFB